MSFLCPRSLFLFFFFNDTATTEIYTLSLHDALPISMMSGPGLGAPARVTVHSREETPPYVVVVRASAQHHDVRRRSEEHTSELQSRLHLVCRLLLEKKKHDQRQPDDATTQLHCPRER